MTSEESASTKRDTFTLSTSSQLSHPCKYTEKNQETLFPNTRHIRLYDEALPDNFPKKNHSPTHKQVTRRDFATGEPFLQHAHDSTTIRYHISPHPNTSHSTLSTGDSLREFSMQPERSSDTSAEGETKLVDDAFHPSKHGPPGGSHATSTWDSTMQHTSPSTNPHQSNPSSRSTQHQQQTVSHNPQRRFPPNSSSGGHQFDYSQSAFESSSSAPVPVPNLVVRGRQEDSFSGEQVPSERTHQELSAQHAATLAQPESGWPFLQSSSFTTQPLAATTIIPPSNSLDDSTNSASSEVSFSSNPKKRKRRESASDEPKVAWGRRGSASFTHHICQSPPQHSPQHYTVESSNSTHHTLSSRNVAPHFENFSLTREDFLSVSHLSQEEAAELFGISLSTFKRRLRSLQPKIKWPSKKDRKLFVRHSQKIQNMCHMIIDRNASLLHTMGVNQSSDDLDLIMDSDLRTSSRKLSPTMREQLRSIRQENQELFEQLQEILRRIELMFEQSCFYRNMAEAFFFGDLKELPGPWNEETPPSIGTDSDLKSQKASHRSKQLGKRTFLDKSALYLSDAHGRIVACNSAFLELTGFSWKDFQGANNEGDNISETQIYLRTSYTNQRSLQHLLHIWYTSGVVHTMIPAMSLCTKDGNIVTVSHECRLITDNRQQLYTWHELTTQDRHSDVQFPWLIQLDGTDVHKQFVSKNSRNIEFSFEERSQEQAYLFHALYYGIQQHKRRDALRMSAIAGNSSP